MDSQPITETLCSHSCKLSNQKSLLIRDRWKEKFDQPAVHTDFSGETMYLPSKTPAKSQRSKPRTHGLPKLAAEEERMISQHIEQLPRV